MVYVRRVIKQQNLLLELNNLKLNESNKERDLVRLNYLKTQSELKNESLEKRAQKKQLTIAEKEIQLNKITLAGFKKLSRKTTKT